MASLWADFLTLSLWWACLVALGLSVLPLTARFFGRFFDAGYPFAKIVATGAVAYGTWLAASLGVLPFTRGSALGLWVAVTIVAFSSKERRDAAWRLVRERRRVILVEEAAFLAMLLFWAYLRGIRPEILGLEKFMDYGFAASIARAPYMPPPDMWLAGETINYYYFGHFVLAFLAKLTDIELAVAYNLMTATLPALTFCAIVSLAGNLVHASRDATPRRVWLAGVLSATLLTFGGNLHAFVFGYARPALERLNVLDGSDRPAALRGYRYYDATRYVGYDPPTHERTIHEFPFYSFVVADLHAHVSNVPFVLSFLAFLMAYLLEPTTAPARAGPLSLRFAAVTGFSLALFQMTNAWDVPIYAFIALLVLVSRMLLEEGGSRRFLVAVATLGVTAVLYALLSLPFTLHFENHYRSLGFVEGRTPLHQILILWGTPLALVLLYAASASLEAAPWVRRVGLRRVLADPRATLRAMPRTDLHAVLLILSALGLVLLPEVVYVRDIYIELFYRANTMFKLTYQASILFAVVLGYCAVRGTASRPVWVAALSAIMLALPLFYTAPAVRGFYGRLHPFHYEGLDGLAFLADYRPGDGAAVQWLNANVHGSPVVLEANGYSYTDYGRISMATGLPTVIGWYVHEWLWRGNHDVVDRRSADVTRVYEAGSSPEGLEAAREVLDAFDVSFIVLGNLERSRFPGLDEAALLELGDVVFEADGTTVLRVNREE